MSELRECPYADALPKQDPSHRLKITKRTEYATSDPPYSVLCTCGAAGPLSHDKEQAAELWNAVACRPPAPAEGASDRHEHDMSAREELLSLLDISRDNCARYEEYAELAGKCLEEQFLRGCSTGADACGNAFRQILARQARISPAGAAETCDRIANDYVIQRVRADEEAKQ